jgi:hypothetical protein
MLPQTIGEDCENMSAILLVVLPQEFRVAIEVLHLFSVLESSAKEENGLLVAGWFADLLRALEEDGGLYLFPIAETRSPEEKEFSRDDAILFIGLIGTV